MFIKEILIKTKRKLSNIFSLFNKKGEQLSDRHQNLTSIPGIGEKTARLSIKLDI